MTAVLDQVKNVAYTGVGVNLAVTDAIIGREVPAPKAVTEHAATARAKGTEPSPIFVVAPNLWPPRSSSACRSRSPGRRDRSQGRLGLPRHRCTEGHRPEGRQEATKKA